MNPLPHLMTGTLLLLQCLPALAEDTAPLRDPFWPIGYQPAGDPVPETPATEADPDPEAPRTLTDDELRALARDEAERIRESLVRRGTMTAGDRIYAHIQGRWVTVGDSFTVDVGGRQYRLLITRLTSNNIELEPHRVPLTTPNTGNAP